MLDHVSQQSRDSLVPGQQLGLGSHPGEDMPDHASCVVVVVVGAEKIPVAAAAQVAAVAERFLAAAAAGKVQTVAGVGIAVGEGIPLHIPHLRRQPVRVQARCHQQ